MRHTTAISGGLMVGSKKSCFQKTFGNKSIEGERDCGISPLFAREHPPDNGADADSEWPEFPRAFPWE
ncbi:MAG: hypothetical protein C0478_14605 [Planctomyces sp.]|nr:hypothetical protein [Planctomyces sp.]